LLVAFPNDYNGVSRKLDHVAAVSMNNCNKRSRYALTTLLSDVGADGQSAVILEYPLMSTNKSAA
jgi:hypothetical protein